jgi:DNA modification methylase
VKFYKYEDDLGENYCAENNCMDWPRDNETPKVHPTQKPVLLLEHLIRIFTDENDVVIDPCAGSAVTLLAANNTNRKAYGFEIKKDFFKEANDKILTISNRYFSETPEKQHEFFQPTIDI